MCEHNKQTFRITLTCSIYSRMRAKAAFNKHLGILAQAPVDQPEKNPSSLSMEILFDAIVPHIAETPFGNRISCLQSVQ